jgi:membrane-bound serine protease (ClpP class)
MSKRNYLLLPLLILLLTVSVIGQVKAAGAEVYWLKVDGAINPPLADYLSRGISQAEEAGAEACIIELNTPGGLLTSTEKIVNDIFDSKVPIVVYVNGWAASAGTFITLASDVAVMRPGSVIGAAAAVSAGGGEIPETEAKKIEQHTVNWIRGIAEARGKNPDAAEDAVREAKSYSAETALEKNLIDMLAEPGELLTKLEERGLPVGNAHRVDFNMSTMERFLYAISDPNIAYILLNIAMLGILIELSHPGLIVPGVVGGICLLMAIYALDILEADWAGLILIILAFGLFIAEIFTPTFGFLTAGGIVSLILGSLILFRGGSFHVNYWLIGGVVVVVAGILIFIIGAVVRGQRRRAVTGYEGMIGKVAVAQTELDPEGVVFIRGEHWKAVSEKGKIEPEEEVVITKVDRLKLRVIRKSN